ncbi:glycosyltransferase [Mucilaginibacter defluvii]|uniref:Glycosyltransferase n=1 Tax=Mucilaginibacter defluvii TaxID=1196019 RepID=A0ABP9G121_9SPHI
MNNQLKMFLKGRKILFATVPADGHINPLTGLAKFLQEEAECDVRWYTASIYEQKMNRLGIPHYPFAKAREITGENLLEALPERELITDPIKKINFDMIHIFGERGPEYYQEIKDIYENFPFEIMVADNLFTGIPFVKNLMNIPVIAIGIIPLIERSADVAPYGSGLYPPTTIEECENNAKMYASFGEMMQESTHVFDTILAAHGLEAPEGGIGDKLLQTSDAYLQIGVPSFEYPRQNLGKNIQFIGALMPYLKKTGSATWADERLNTYKEVILVTQGTVERDINKLIVPTLDAFAGSNILVVATTGGNGTAELRERFNAPNLIIEDYIPFQDIMPYSDVFVTNGGYSGTLLGIQHQLPVVAAGIHEGKNEVCARIGYFEYGINLQTDTPTADAIRTAVEEVLNNDKYRKNVSKLLEDFKSYPSETLCAEAIAKLLYTKSSNSQKSAVLN